MDFPGGSVVKNLPANAGDVGSIPGLERAPGEGNGNPVRYPCLGNPMDRGAWPQNLGFSLVTKTTRKEVHFEVLGTTSQSSSPEPLP